MKSMTNSIDGNFRYKENTGRHKAQYDKELLMRTRS